MSSLQQSFGLQPRCFCSPGTSGKVWRHSWVSRLGGRGSCYPVEVLQWAGPATLPSSVQRARHPTKNDPVQTLTVRSLRKSGLESPRFISSCRLSVRWREQRGPAGCPLGHQDGYGALEPAKALQDHHTSPGPFQHSPVHEAEGAAAGNQRPVGRWLGGQTLGSCSGSGPAHAAA